VIQELQDNHGVEVIYCIQDTQNSKVIHEAGDNHEEEVIQ